MPHESRPARERLLRDPAGNALALAVLVAMVLLRTFSVRQVLRPRGRMREWPGWAVPTLAAVGIGLAGYLAFFETSGVQALCGPVGDRNRVQEIR